jgi:glycosyltransferase involved in cell wall biosynthesis
MLIVNNSYSKSPEFDDPQKWLRRINFYTGVLEQLAINNKVISIERINYEGVYIQNKVHYHFVNQKKKVGFVPFRTHTLIKKLKPDIILINGFIFPLQIIQLRIFVGRSVKIIILHRAEKPFSNWKKYAQKLADKCVNAYLFASLEFGKDWIEKGIIDDRKKLFEVMQSSSHFYPKNKNDAKLATGVKGSPVFLWVGRLNANKDPVTVVKAFIRFLSYQPAAKLYMIYQSTELLKAVQSLIEQDAKAIEAIKLAGHVDHDQMVEWYNSSDFIISSSHYEGSGIAVCEAMSCGCVPLLTDIFSFRSMTGPNKCGLLFKVGNVDDLLSILVKACGMNIEAESEKTLNQFRRELSFEAIAQKIQTIISSLE